MAYVYGRPMAPSWVVEMEAAEKWFTQPWKVVGGSKTLWFARFEAVRDAKIKRNERIRRQRENLVRNKKHGR